MACDFDITKENIYDYIIEDTPGADEAIKALSGICYMDSWKAMRI